MLDWTKIQEECPNALIEWAKSHLKISDKTKIKLSPADAAFAARRLKDEDIYAMPGYFDKLGIFIKTDVYWGANDENHAVEISIRNGDTIVCDCNGNWSEILSHTAYIHVDRLHAIAVGVNKAFRIHESQILEAALKNKEDNDK